MNHVGYEYDLKNSAKLLQTECNLVIDLVVLADFNPQVASFVKDRLKCSKDEVRLAEALIKESKLCADNKQSLAVLAVRLEKAELRQTGLREVYLSLVGVGLYSKTDLDQALGLIKMYPDVLLTVIDLKNEKTPDFMLSHISEVLRELQFTGTLGTKEQAIKILPDLIRKQQIQKSTDDC